MNAPQPIDPRVSRCVEEWKHKLVDLTKRNRLLYFRQSKSSTLFISQPEAQKIFEKLVVKEKAWEFWFPPEQEGETQHDSLFEDDQLEHQSEGFEPEINRDKHLVCKGLDKKNLERILKNLYKRATTDYRERGVRILYVTFGMLVWKEAPTTEDVGTSESVEIRSPLILVPVELVRESARDHFCLHIADESDVILNPALQVKLQNDFRIDLPSLPEDWKECTLSNYFRSVTNSGGRLGWSIEPSVQIGLFSFHKLVMYQDLTTNKPIVAQHVIITALAEERRRDDLIQTDLPTEKDLDTIQQPIKTFQILDADSSQQVCIQYALRGQSFVIQGPPGTGKSQTIANIIAECIAAGKTVLFVSEKMAALEVVYKRLREVGIGDFCLELHSHKANKRKVVAELERCLMEQQAPRTSMSALEFEKLTRLREKLNNYVLALHCKREPLNWSAYEVLGFLTKLEGIPYIPVGLPNLHDLGPDSMQTFEELVSQLQRVWKVVEEKEKFPWRGFKGSRFTLQTRSQLSSLLDRLIREIKRLREVSVQYAASLGLDAPSSCSDVEWLVNVSNFLDRSPRPHMGWINYADLDSIVAEAKHYQELFQKHRTTRESIETRYNQAFFELPEGIKSQIENAWSNTSKCVSPGDPQGIDLLQYRKELLQFVRETQALVQKWSRDVSEIAQLMGLQTDNLTVNRIKQLGQLALLCHSEKRPDSNWLDLLHLQKVRDIVPKAKAEYATYNSRKQKLMDLYDEGFLNLELDRLIEKYTGIYSTIFRWFLPSFYRDKKTIARTTRTGIIPPSIREDLLAARELLRLDHRLQTEFIDIPKLLGQHYKGYATDFELIEHCICVAAEAIELAGVTNIPRELIAAISIGQLPPPELRTVGTKLLRFLKQWEETAQRLSSLVPLQRLPHTGLPIHQSLLSELGRWASEIETPLATFCNFLDNVHATCPENFPTDLPTIIHDLRCLDELRLFFREIESESGCLRERFGARYRGIETSWDDVLKALEWVHQFRGLFGTRPVPTILARIAAQGADAVPPKIELFQVYERVKDLLQSFENNFEPPILKKPGFLQTAEDRLDDNLTSHVLSLQDRPFSQLPFERLHERLRQFLDRIDDLQLWIDFKNLEGQFSTVGLSTFLKQLVEDPPSASTLIDVFRKSIYQSWMERIFVEDSRLGEFRGQQHNQLIEEFRELDRKFVKFSPYRVIEQANQRRPQVVFRDGEVGILLSEAGRQRRHLPLRQLFKKISNLLLRLKPCLMMSPISVSQFLNPDCVRFDLVIFDEASQICPEDAVGSIYRGNQLIVAGDKRQLPPTAFFQQAMAEEYDWDDISDEEFAVFQSILDACVPILPVKMLRWHYRSKHESLIAFSNTRFYEDKLVTFPSARHEHESLGVKFIHVPDGIYDRGGKRDNPREAEVVADFVFDHCVRFPSKTLGVVAFSIAQMTAIEDEIEQRRREHPEYESFFKEDRLEGFFVKNLENVQGDERDVIILSVGYGKDQHGRITMHFGPLNKDGGERRLNVAITRAREKVVIISSIKAADVDVSAPNTPAGVLHLRNYLDYAERGVAALSLSHPTSLGEYESPLEEDVANEIRRLGYNVVSQVGCSGYRIDLGVVDPAEPGQFLLGVECDGAHYHSGYTARERDRLRQQVLRKLGWRIHRIWSPDWVARREAEIKRLKLAIENAREPISHSLDPADSADIQVDQSEGVVTDTHTRRIGVADPDQLWDIPGIVPYEVAKLKRPRGNLPPFHDTVSRPLQCELLTELVQKEGPIHINIVSRRLLSAWGLDRTGTRITKSIIEAAKLCERRGRLRREGKFLWPVELTTVRVRIPSDSEPESLRAIEHIPSEEIKKAMILIVQYTVGISVDTLIVRTARMFGFDRTGDNIRNRLLKVYNNALRTGELVQDVDTITLGESALGD